MNYISIRIHFFEFSFVDLDKYRMFICSIFFPNYIQVHFNAWHLSTDFYTPYLASIIYCKCGHGRLVPKCPILTNIHPITIIEDLDST